MAKSMNRHFQDMFGALYGGAAIVKGTDLLGHANQPAAIVGDIQGLAGIGVAGVVGGVALKAATGGFKIKRRRKRR